MVGERGSRFGRGKERQTNSWVITSCYCTCAFVLARSIWPLSHPMESPLADFRKRKCLGGGVRHCQSEIKHP